MPQYSVVLNSVVLQLVNMFSLMRTLPPGFTGSHAFKCAVLIPLSARGGARWAGCDRCAASRAPGSSFLASFADQRSATVPVGDRKVRRHDLYL